jgi:hypothetical protein
VGRGGGGGGAGDSGDQVEKKREGIECSREEEERRD